MIPEKIALGTICGISFAGLIAKIGALIAASSPLNGITQQDFAALTSGFSILGLAAITLYGKFRQERLKWNELDAKSAPARIAALERELSDSRSEAARWKDLCTSLQALKDTDSWVQRGESEPPT